MLQPSQIETVSIRYVTEIAEVSNFLRGAGVPVEMPAALNDVVRRLESDRAFHRDLGSHAWMLLYSGVTVPETLAVLVVATLGARSAATADEDSTHALLRFIMESRSQLAGKSAVVQAPVPASSTVRETIVDAPPREEHRASISGAPPASFIAPPGIKASTPEEPSPALRAAAMDQPETLRSIPLAIVVATLPAVMEESTAEDIALPTRTEPDVSFAQRSKRGLVILIAACLLVFAAVGWWFLRRPSAAPTNAPQPAPVVEGTASSSAEPPPEVVVPPQQKSLSARSEHQATHRTSVSREPLGAASAPASRYIRPAPYAGNPPAWRQPAPDSRAETPVPAPVLRVAPVPSPRNPSAVTPVDVVSRRMSGPVPNSVLSTRLGSPTVNQADAVDDRVAGTKGYPHLLRRKPLVLEGTLVAKAAPMVMPGTRAAAIPSGMVRSTSLGISAGNLVYAPDPVYPADAASQHISGQVKLEAMVDREGNVASARVISGPPLLRDAAVNAVQQWRYRPYRAGGKPQTFTATAVMDFQLQ